MKTNILLLIACLFWSGTLLAQLTTANITDNPRGIAYAAQVESVSGNYTVTSRDHTILADATSAAITITLLPAKARYQVINVKKSDVSANTVTVSASNSQTIDGAPTIVLTGQHQNVTLQSTGLGWNLISPNVSVVRKISLGAPRDDETNRAVTSTTMRASTYTIVNQPDVPRNVTLTQTTVAGADTLGTVVIVGTDYRGNALTETLTPVAGTLVTGTKVFKTVTSLTGVGWVATSTADNIVIGYGALIGLPVTLPAAGTALGTLDTVVAVKVTTGGTLATSAVTEAGGDGSKLLVVYVNQ